MRGLMDAGTWGKCELCGEAILPARLAALPETPWCLACARSLERDDRRPAPGRRVADDPEDD